MNRHLQLMELTLALAQPRPQQRWQSDRRSGRNAGPRADDERRSGVDNRRQPRMPSARRAIYPD